MNRIFVWSCVYLQLTLSAAVDDCSVSTFGADYRGQQSRTISGRICQRWDSQVPHPHNYTSSQLFPDVHHGYAGTPANYCRNPDASNRIGPWCFTTDPEILWEYCNVSKCYEYPECRVTERGEGYRGSRSHTITNTKCLPWTNFWTCTKGDCADVTAPENNYCRNPDNERRERPWCFVGENGEWEYCDVPLCKKKEAPRNKFQQRIGELPVRHVIHIGVDGLHPCFVQAPAPNMMPRLSSEGAWTLSARSTSSPISAPAWTAILCSLQPESSGIMDNEWLPPWMGFTPDVMPVTGRDTPFPCIFDVLKSYDVNIRLGAFYNWDWLQYLMSTGRPTRLDTENYCVDSRTTPTECDDRMTNDMMSYLKNILQASEKSYTFLHLNAVDSAGHKYGWCNLSVEYMESVSVVDQQIGRILDLLDTMNKQDKVMVIVSSDHGGHDDVHDSFLDSDITVPLFIRGPGIKTNYEMKYGIRTVDTTPTILQAMGYLPNPWWEGTPLDQIFESF